MPCLYCKTGDEYFREEMCSGFQPKVIEGGYKEILSGVVDNMGVTTSVVQASDCKHYWMIVETMADRSPSVLEAYYTASEHANWLEKATVRNFEFLFRDFNDMNEGLFADYVKRLKLDSNKKNVSEMKKLCAIRNQLHPRSLYAREWLKNWCGEHCHVPVKKIKGLEKRDQMTTLKLPGFIESLKFLDDKTLEAGIARTVKKPVSKVEFAYVYVQMPEGVIKEEKIVPEKEMKYKPRTTMEGTCYDGRYRIAVTEQGGKSILQVSIAQSGKALFSHAFGATEYVHWVAVYGDMAFAVLYETPHEGGGEALKCLAGEILEPCYYDTTSASVELTARYDLYDKKYADVNGKGILAYAYSSGFGQGKTDTLAWMCIPSNVLTFDEWLNEMKHGTCYFAPETLMGGEITVYKDLRLLYVQYDKNKKVTSLAFTNEERMNGLYYKPLRSQMKELPKEFADEFKKKVYATPEDYLKMYKKGMLQIGAGLTTDQQWTAHPKREQDQMQAIKTVLKSGSIGYFTFL